VHPNDGFVRINSILKRMWTGAEEVKLNTAHGRLATSVQPIKGGKGRCEKAGWLKLNAGQRCSVLRRPLGRLT